MFLVEQAFMGRDKRRGPLKMSAWKAMTLQTKRSLLVVYALIAPYEIHIVVINNNNNNNVMIVVNRVFTYVIKPHIAYRI